MFGSREEGLSDCTQCVLGARGGADGGQLDIAVGYLPSYGTLMVDATVRDPGTGEEEAIRCAVHYANADGGFYYCVCPEGTGLELPDFENEGQSFAEWVSGASGRGSVWNWLNPSRRGVSGNADSLFNPSSEGHPRSVA